MAGFTSLAPPSDLAEGVKPVTPVPDDSASQHSETAHDFITSQLQLEAEARETLPYSFSHCTRPLGALKQNLFACLTCNPPESPTFQPAAVCYSCSIACHGEHTLVELFQRRNFTCDCGTARMPETAPCTLRIDPETGTKRPVKGEEPAKNNTYNKNCRNRFCGCEELYDPHQEKGTMFQCLGLAEEKDGGCGEDWWHPECVTGLGREAWAKSQPPKEAKAENAEETDTDEVDENDHPLPPNFPKEDDFESFICYKCANANPWIKQYAGTAGFLPRVLYEPRSYEKSPIETHSLEPNATGEAAIPLEIPARASSPKRKRTSSDADLDNHRASSPKQPRLSGSSDLADPTPISDQPYHVSLPSLTQAPFSLFLESDYRDHFCRCTTCYPRLQEHRQLLEEEAHYSPPLSSASSVNGDNNDTTSIGQASQRSLLERGEAALSNVDRIRAIEGVMVYNHLKDKVKAFLQPFAESGQAVGAEDIKAYFEKLRGDEGGIRGAAAEVEAAGNNGGAGDGEGDKRREQGGY